MWRLLTWGGRGRGEGETGGEGQVSDQDRMGRPILYSTGTHMQRTSFIICACLWLITLAKALIHLSAFDRSSDRPLLAAAAGADGTAVLSTSANTRGIQLMSLPPTHSLPSLPAVRPPITSDSWLAQLFRSECSLCRKDTVHPRFQLVAVCAHSTAAGTGSLV